MSSLTTSPAGAHMTRALREASSGKYHYHRRNLATVAFSRRHRQPVAASNHR